jgi:hypothetical protein
MHEEAGHIVETPVEARAGFRSTDAGCADCQYEPDDWSVCRALYRFFLRGKPAQLAASSLFIQNQ